MSTHPVPTLSLLPDGSWILLPDEEPVAGAGEWFTFEALYPLTIACRTIQTTVYGSIKGREGSVGIELWKCPAGITEETLLPHMLAEVMIRSVPGEGGGFTWQVATSTEEPPRVLKLRTDDLA